MEDRLLLHPQTCQQLHILGFQEGSSGYGDGFPSRREQGEAVRHPFGEPKPLARFQPLQHLQSVDATLRTAGEAEPWHSLLPPQITALDVHQPSVSIPIRKEQRGGIVVGFSMSPTRGRHRDGGDAQPTDHCRMYPPLTEKKLAGFGIEHRMLHQSGQVFHIGRKFPLRFLGGFPFGEDDVMLVRQPPACLDERFSEDMHREVDGSSVGIAHKAFVGVPPHVEGERRMAVGMKRTECLVFLHLQSEPLRHSLDGEIAEFIEFKLFHHFTIFTYRFTFGSG